jgi:hypothetical protein
MEIKWRNSCIGLNKKKGNQKFLGYKFSGEIFRDIIN